jgi:hypothetical protein
MTRRLEWMVERGKKKNIGAKSGHRVKYTITNEGIAKNYSFKSRGVILQDSKNFNDFS